MMKNLHFEELVQVNGGGFGWPVRWPVGWPNGWDYPTKDKAGETDEWPNGWDGKSVFRQ